ALVPRRNDLGSGRLRLDPLEDGPQRVVVARVRREWRGRELAPVCVAGGEACARSESVDLAPVAQRESSGGAALDRVHRELDRRRARVDDEQGLAQYFGPLRANTRVAAQEATRVAGLCSGPAERVRLALSPARISSNVRLSITTTISDDSATDALLESGCLGRVDPAKLGCPRPRVGRRAPTPCVHHTPTACLLVAPPVAAALHFSAGMKTALAAAVAAATLTLPALAQGPAEQGQRYFMNSGCYGCHTVGKMGTP